MNRYYDVLKIILEEMGMEKGGTVEVGVKLSKAAERICEEILDEKIVSKREVVVLGTNNIFAKVTRYQDTDKLSLDTMKLAEHSNQHIYITNDEPTKENDWILDYRTSPVLFHQISCELPPEKQKQVKKVVACTDTYGLSIDGDECPQISLAYTEYIIESLNQGIPVPDDIINDDENLIIQPEKKV